ncbi:DUF1992 domain-containing protein [Gorillibacterium sp. sgz5001074]|uniref:DUF1992 domain-containing protein n=1 Tax=Gorillibacterium sp. sgz5001074 TaxID=3446695 RepID=UPI003F68144D
MFKRNKTAGRPDPSERLEPGPEPRAHIPLPADLFVDHDAAVAGQAQLKHWLDEAYEEFEKRGGPQSLPGYGKPLVIPTGDVMNTILKNAGIPHPWVLLRQTILEAMEDTVRLMDRKPDDAEIDRQLADINRRIVQMNVEAPSLTLHRRKVTRDTIREQIEKWR